MLLIARIVKHKTIKDTIQWVDMLTSKVKSVDKYLFRLASLSSVYQSLTKDFKTPFFDKLGGILLIRSYSSLKYTGEIWGMLCPCLPRSTVVALRGLGEDGNLACTFV